MCRSEDDIKRNHKEIGWELVDCIHLTQDRNKWQTCEKQDITK
jgi:hypothetical protein